MSYPPNNDAPNPLPTINLRSIVPFLYSITTQYCHGWKGTIEKLWQSLSVQMIPSGLAKAGTDLQNLCILSVFRVPGLKVQGLGIRFRVEGLGLGLRA